MKKLTKVQQRENLETHEMYRLLSDSNLTYCIHCGANMNNGRAFTCEQFQQLVAQHEENSEDFS